MTWKRVATAAVLIPIVVGLVLWASTAWVALAMALIIALALFEYFALGDAIGQRAYRFWTVACAMLLVFFQFAAANYDNSALAGLPILERSFFRIGYPTPVTFEGFFFIFILGLVFLTCVTRRPLVEGLPSVGISSSGLLLVAFPLSFAVRLHAEKNNGPYLLLFVLVIVWVGDTTAYFVGRNLGRFKLAPKLSPNKTWEGALASLAGSLLVGVAFVRWIPASVGALLGMAAVANIAGQLGDLVESAYKRSAGIKDSGTLLPGHGGMLDRIDALILAIPVVWYYWSWFLSVHRQIE